jgi:hypothetical protein
MATSIAGGRLASIPATERALLGPRAAAGIRRRRKTTPEAGQAIEMLGHAIEYLADEFSLECMNRQENVAAGMHPRVVAIEILKKCNREVYLSCPEVPTCGEWMESWFRLGLRKLKA